MMATEIYESGTITLLDGTELYITPLKIKYLREFMKSFDGIKETKGDDESISVLVDCARIGMKQYMPSLKTAQDVEDAIDIPTLYQILKFAAGISIEKDSNEMVNKQAKDSGPSWDDLDLAKLEAEVFLLGIWKDYDELESSLSMPELSATLSSKREVDYQEKKFLAAIQGINLDEKTQNKNAWEDLKARVFSRGKTDDSNDVTSLQGYNAQKVGFGIGLGLDYEDLG
jgi:hypothetical protein